MRYAYYAVEMMLRAARAIRDMKRVFSCFIFFFMPFAVVLLFAMIYSSPSSAFFFMLRHAAAMAQRHADSATLCLMFAVYAMSFHADALLIDAR